MGKKGLIQKPKRPADMNKLAKSIVDIATGQESSPDNDQAAKKSKAGKKGARARAMSLTPEQREDMARVAATARWKKD